MTGPLDGAPDAPTAGHHLCHFIPHFGCSGRHRRDSAGFTFETCALVDPTAIMDPVSDTVSVSHNVKGTLYEELDDA
jgi:hypothetical protein